MRAEISFFITICVFVNGSIQAQNKPCIDTATVILKKYGDFNQQLGTAFLNSYFLNDTIYFCANREIKKKAMSVEKVYGNGDLSLCKQKSYFYFYSKSSKLIAEGNWFIEFFIGSYKDYYESGKLKSEGYYYSERKEKKWKYYSEEGKLIKEEEYDNNGNLTATKTY